MKKNHILSPKQNLISLEVIGSLIATEMTIIYDLQDLPM